MARRTWLLVGGLLGAGLARGIAPARAGDTGRASLPASQVITTLDQPRFGRAAAPRPLQPRPIPPELFEPLPDEQSPSVRRPSVSFGVDFSDGFTVMVRYRW